MLIRDLILFAGFCGVIIFSDQPVLPFSLAFWAIFLPLLIVEWFGSYVIIHNTSITRYAWFFSWQIPFEKITRLDIEEFYGIGKAPTLTLIYQSSAGKERKDYILNNHYSKVEIKRFVTALTNAAPEMQIGEKVHSFLDKN